MFFILFLKNEKKRKNYAFTELTNNRVSTTSISLFSNKLSMNFKNNLEINTKFHNKLIGYLIKLDRRYCKGAVGEKKKQKKKLHN